MVIVKGTAEVLKTGHTGKINSLRINDMIGEASLMVSYYLRSATVRAKSNDVQVLELQRETYIALKASALIEERTDEGIRRLSMSLVAADQAREVKDGNSPSIPSRELLKFSD